MMECCLSRYMCAEAVSSSFEFYSTIQEISENVWSRFIHEENVLLQYNYLKLLEETQQNQMQFLYVLVREENDLIGVCYFQLITFKGTNLSAYFPTEIEGASYLKRCSTQFINLFKPFIEKINLTIAVFGNRFMTGEKGYYFRNTVDKNKQGKIITALVEKIFRQYPSIKVALMTDAYYPEDEIAAAFITNQYRKIEIESDMKMDLLPEWKIFDDYLQALSSKYRVRAKKILSTSSAIECKSLSAEEIDTHTDELYALYQHVALKVDFNMAVLTKDYFYKQKRLNPNGYFVFGYYLQNELIGFITSFVHGKEVEVHYIGLNYAHNATYHLYQRMLYDIIKFAIETNYSKLHFGRTAPEVKSTIGAIEKPMYGYLKHRNFCINYFIEFFTKNLKPKKYQLRNPFKENLVR